MKKKAKRENKKLIKRIARFCGVKPKKIKRWCKPTEIKDGIAIYEYQGKFNLVKGAYLAQKFLYEDKFFSALTQLEQLVEFYEGKEKELTSETKELLDFLKESILKPLQKADILPLQIYNESKEFKKNEAKAVQSNRAIIL